VTDNNNGGVRSTSVSVTLNGKSLGVDAFIKLEETFEFSDAASEADAIFKRDEVSAILTDQILEIVAKTAESVRAVSQQARPVASQQYQPAPQQQQYQPAPAYTPAQQVQAVANGASFQSDWRTIASKFGDGDMRYLSIASYSTQRLEQDSAAWLNGHGLNPTLFKVWDNRPGPRGLEANVPNGSVATIKIGRDIIDACPPDFQRIPAARVKFNSDGSLYIYFTKEFEAFLKFGGSNIFSTQPQASPFK